MESLDHGEDWFVASNTSAHARCFYAGEMGYDEIDDEITALEVCEVPGFPAIDEAFFADSDIIKHCGGELKFYDNADLLSEIDKGILQEIDGDSRIVKFNNTIFVEGSVARTALYYLKNQ
ncbi:MAG: hypothetical protein ACJA0N_002848 [Pseudohongiellaceae bacterium]|jgi:hypothetical protein